MFMNDCSPADFVIDLPYSKLIHVLEDALLTITVTVAILLSTPWPSVALYVMLSVPINPVFGV